mgnify:CR=1 FL=1
MSLEKRKKEHLTVIIEIIYKKLYFVNLFIYYSV